MKTQYLFTIERKYASHPHINDIRDWLNVWSTTDFRKETIQINFKCI